MAGRVRSTDSSPGSFPKTAFKGRFGGLFSCGLFRLDLRRVLPSHDYRDEDLIHKGGTLADREGDGAPEEVKSVTKKKSEPILSVLQPGGDMVSQKGVVRWTDSKKWYREVAKFQQGGNLP